MRKRRWRWLTLFVALAAGWWLLLEVVPIPATGPAGYLPHGPPDNHPASRVVPDDRPSFRIEPARPWRLGLGRGSGWHGFDTVKLDQTGRVILHRLSSSRRTCLLVSDWETATLRLRPAALSEVLAAVEEHRLLELDRAYHASRTASTRSCPRQPGRASGGAPCYRSGTGTTSANCGTASSGRALATATAPHSRTGGGVS
jgi:hypothetical protein